MPAGRSKGNRDSALSSSPKSYLIYLVGCIRKASRYLSPYYWGYFEQLVGSCEGT